MNAKVKIRPLHDRVMIESLEEVEQRTAGGLVIPGTAKEKPMIGVVRAIGSGKPLDDGKVRPLSVKVGDKILFGKYAGTEVKLDNKEFLIMREEDIMGIID